MFKKTFYSISAHCAIMFTAAAIFTGCTKSTADSSSNTFTGDNLTVTHNGGKFLAPEGAKVSADFIGNGNASIKMDGLITGFPSVTEVCTVTTSNDTTYFKGTTEVSQAEKISIEGFIHNNRIIFDYAETIHSSTTDVEKWMIGEKTLEDGTIVPDIELTINSSDSTLIALSETGTTLLRAFFMDQSRFFDYVELAYDGRLGVYHEDYHAADVISRDSVNMFWSAVRGGFFIGDIVSPGPLGQLSFYQTDKIIGATLSNTFVENFNWFLRWSIDVPIYIPFEYKVDPAQLDIYLTQDLMYPLLVRYYYNIMTFLNAFTYDKFLDLFPAELRDLIRGLVPQEDFDAFIENAKRICRLIISDETDLKIHISFIPYEKELRPWES